MLLGKQLLVKEKFISKKIYLVIFDKSADDVGIAHISEDAYEDIFRHIHTFLAKYAA